MKYFLGNAYINFWKNKIIISSDNKFSILIEIENNKNIHLNKIDDNKSYEIKCNKIILKHNTDSYKIIGYTNFIFNLSMLLKNYIKEKKIEKEKLNIFYKLFYNLTKEFFKNLEDI